MAEAVLVTAASVAAKLNKTLSEGELASMQLDIDAITEELESELNCYLYRRQVVVSAEPITDIRWLTTKLNLRGPIVRIEDVTRDIDGESVWWQVGQSVFDRDSIYIAGAASVVSSYTVTYTAGLLTPSPAAMKLITDVIVRNAIVGQKVASGALASFSVEGVSVNYGAAASKSNADARGSFSPSELVPMNKLRRRVMA